MMWSSIASMILVLALLGGLAWLLRRVRGLPAAGANLQVIETVAFGAGATLALVGVGGRRFLVASSQQGVSLLGEIDAADLTRPAGGAGPRIAFPPAALSRRPAAAESAGGER